MVVVTKKTVYRSIKHTEASELLRRWGGATMVVVGGRFCALFPRIVSIKLLNCLGEWSYPLPSCSNATKSIHYASSIPLTINIVY